MPAGVRAAALACRQHDIVTTSDLAALGIVRDRVHRWSRTGRLHRLHRGVYKYGSRSLTREGRWLAAVRACGTGAVLSHLSAACLWGLLEADPVVIDVTVPSWRRGRDGLRLHTSPLRPGERGGLYRVPATSPERTWLDLAAMVGDERARRALSEGERAGILDPAALRASLGSGGSVDVGRGGSRDGGGRDGGGRDGGGRDGGGSRGGGRDGGGRYGEDSARGGAEGRGVPGRTAARRVLDAYRPLPPGMRFRSNLERTFWEAWLETGLEPPEVNARICGLEVDMLWLRSRLVVELDGRRWHRTGADRECDERRDRLLAGAGLTVMRFDDAEVRADLAGVVAAVTAALAADGVRSRTFRRLWRRPQRS